MATESSSLHICINPVNLSSVSSGLSADGGAQAPGAPLSLVFHARSQQRLWDECNREAEQHGHAELIHAVQAAPSLFAACCQPSSTRRWRATSTRSAPRSGTETCRRLEGCIRALISMGGWRGQQAAGAEGVRIQPMSERTRRRASSHDNRRSRPHRSRDHDARQTTPSTWPASVRPLSQLKERPPESQEDYDQFVRSAELQESLGQGSPAGPGPWPVPPDRAGPGSAECLGERWGPYFAEYDWCSTCSSSLRV